MPGESIWRRARRVGIASFALLFGFGAAGTLAAGAAERAASRSGGTLTMLTSLDTASWDPASFGFITNLYAGVLGVYDQLFTENADSGAVEGRMAASIASTDATTWTIKLRPNIRFSDGTPLDAEAVRFNWERAKDPATRSPALSLAQTMTSITVVDPTTLRVVLSAPNGQLPRNLVSRLNQIASPTAVRSNAAGLATKPVGAGPFTLESWMPGTEIVLARNPNYWDSPRPYLDRLVIRVLPDQETRYLTFRSGAAQVAAGEFGTSLIYAQRAKADGFKVEFQPTLLPRSFYFGLNLRRAPFKDLRARQALQYAVDPEVLNRVYFQDAGAVTRSVFPETSPFHDAAGTLPKTNAKKAQALFDEVASSLGKPVEMTLLTSDLKEGDVLTALLSTYSNVKVNVNVTTTTDRAARLRNGDFDIFFQGMGGQDPEPGIQNAFGSASSGGYSSPEMTSALTLGAAALELKERQSAYRTVQRIVLNDLPVVFWGVTAPRANWFVDQRKVSNADRAATWQAVAYLGLKQRR